MFLGWFLKEPSERSHILPKKSLPTVVHTIERDGYALAYDGRSKNPYYVFETLTQETICGLAERSRHQFTEDPVLPKTIRAQLADYKGSGYDRGHLSPAANNKQNDKVMAESFILSNICPQQPQFNRGYWAKLEKHVRMLAAAYATVKVFTGPLYLPRMGNDGKKYVMFPVIGEGNVAVPTHFFKVLLLEQKNGSLEQRAYILPNESIAHDTPFEQFETTVELIERASGIIF